MFMCCAFVPQTLRLKKESKTILEMITCFLMLHIDKYQNQSVMQSLNLLDIKLTPKINF